VFNERSLLKEDNLYAIIDGAVILSMSLIGLHYNAWCELIRRLRILLRFAFALPVGYPLSVQSATALQCSTS
jgi:hypothetical protein